MLSETKLDNSFPEGQFLIEGYSKPYRSDRICHWGGIMLYIRADIPSKLLSIESLPMEGFLCRDKPSEKEMVAMLFLQPK